MGTEDVEQWVVYCSPAGSTRRVAEVVGQRLEELGYRVRSCDLGTRAGRAEAARAFPAARSVCLWVGSPVYVNHPVPPVSRFLSDLPAGQGWAVPLVTWGGVSSGTALHELGTALEAKGFRLVGAAKVLAAHSSMRGADRPLGEGHPDGEDEGLVRSLVDAVHEKLTAGAVVPFESGRLRYQPRPVEEAAGQVSLETARRDYPPLRLDPDLCIQCDVCEEHCPVGAITLAPYPTIGNECILCSACARLCPEGALTIDLAQREERLRAMAERIGEQPPTRIFV